MEKTWRWTGKKDEFTLAMLRQIGVEGIVTALYDIPAGEVWPQEAVVELSDFIKEAGMHWSVVDNLPVNKTIMLGGDNADKLIANYVQNLANLGEAGINTVCYNLYPTEYNDLSINATLTNGIFVKENIKFFLSQLMPVCEEYNINMCINHGKLSSTTAEPLHIRTNEIDIEWILNTVDNPYNGIAIHIDSSNIETLIDEIQFAKKFTSRINFIDYLDADILSIGNDTKPSHIEERRQFIDLVRIFEKEKPFIPFCIDKTPGTTRSLQSRIYTFAQIDGIIAAIQSENG